MSGEKKKTNSFIQSSKDIISGIVGGVALVVAGHPLDTIKVRLQTMPTPPPGQPPQFTGTWDCAVKTVRLEGVRGLFKGMVSPITGVPPIYAIVFGAYGTSKRALETYPGDPLTLSRIFVAGCITGVATTIITTPVELVKARLQIQYNQTKPGQVVFSGPGSMAQHIIKQEGIAGLFRGTSATLWRDVPGTGIWFAAYEAIRRGFAAQAGCKPSEIGSLKTLIAGGGTGLVMWLCVFPIDVVKSRVQTAPSGTYAPGTRGMIKCGIELFKETGVKGLYKGIAPALIRSFPANAACFLAQDLAMKVLSKLE